VLGTAQIAPLETGGISPPTDRRARALLAGALGILLGLGVAVAVDRFDTRLRGRDEAEEAFDLPVLAEIPRISRRARADHALLTAAQPTNAAAEAFRSLRSAITLVAQSKRTRSGAAPARTAQQPPQVLVVTGAQGDEGKSTTVVNLATALAETGRSVLVIDCDFRKPEAHLFLDVSPGLGLADLAEADLSGSIDQVISPTAVPGVQLVTGGSSVSHPAGVLARLSGIIAEARDRADIVLIDSSPLLVTSEALDVLQHADAALIVCCVGRTRYEQATRARKLLLRAEVPVLGLVLTRTAPQRRTPYGQTTKRQLWWSRFVRLVKPPAPDEGLHRRGVDDDAADVPLGDFHWGEDEEQDTRSGRQTRSESAG
jgi:capsular exopolysaccharide synthesis family protein